MLRTTALSLDLDGNDMNFVNIAHSTTPSHHIAATRLLTSPMANQVSFHDSFPNPTPTGTYYLFFLLAPI